MESRRCHGKEEGVWHGMRLVPIHLLYHICSPAVHRLGQRLRQQNQQRDRNTLTLLIASNSYLSLLKHQASGAKKLGILFQTLDGELRSSHMSRGQRLSSDSDSQLLFNAAMLAASWEHSAQTILIHNSLFNRYVLCQFHFNRFLS